MQVETIPVGAYEANCVLLWADPSQAWVIDPGAEGEKILKRLESNGLTPALVVLTHGHFDHISALTALLARFPVPVYLHAQDVAFAFSPMNAMFQYPLTAKPATLCSDRDDGAEIACGGLAARVIHTPGHTPGGCCFYFEAEKTLVAGDTLFAGSVGRTDFPGGNWAALKDSLARLMALPEETRVICGHGPATTISVEKQSNPYV